MNRVVEAKFQWCESSPVTSCGEDDDAGSWGEGEEGEKRVGRYDGGQCALISCLLATAVASADSMTGVAD